MDFIVLHVGNSVDRLCFAFVLLFIILLREIIFVNE